MLMSMISAKKQLTSGERPAWLSLVVAAVLAAGLAGAPAASGAAAQTAGADDPSYLSVFAPGAGAAAPVGVQQQTRVGWANVAGWQGFLTGFTNLGTPFTRWPVDPALLGQGPFRAVEFSLDQKSLVAVSDSFYLPVVGGLNLAVTLGPAGAVLGTPPGAMLLGKTLPAPPRQAPLLTASQTTASTSCQRSNCDNAQISLSVSGVPLNSWIAVEWLDTTQGAWLPVPNWESRGDTDPFDISGRLVKHWAVLPALYGHGPFRWAVYAGATGGLIGVSPSFNLPATDRTDLVMHLSP